MSVPKSIPRHPRRQIIICTGVLLLIATFVHWPVYAEEVLGIAGRPASELIAGGDHTCAIRGSELKCWGDRWGLTDADTPQVVQFPVDGNSSQPVVRLASAGLNFRCALIYYWYSDLYDSDVFCWGDNVYGQLGSGNEYATSNPGEIVGDFSNAVALASGGYHSCLLRDSGAVYCWGTNTFGELGIGTTGGHSNVLVQVSDLGPGVIALSVGYNHSCALRFDGKVLCWGRNADGQLGNGQTSDSNIPVTVPLTAPVKQIAAGAYHTCAMTRAGAVYCWGDGLDGEIGNGSSASVNLPQAVTGLDHDIVSIHSGSFHTCAVDHTGTARCWGENSDGQLGNGSTLDANTPQALTYLTRPIAQLVAGASHTCAMDKVGAVSCWGRNNHGQLGRGPSTWPSDSTPASVDDFIALTPNQISAGTEHSCIVADNGAVFCWGYNYHGRLGNDDVPINSRPKIVTQLDGKTARARTVANADRSTCALMLDGTVKCWGDNFYGQLGNNSNTHSIVPVDVHGISNAIDVAAGSDHACALLSTGEVKCWGNNEFGQLGNNSITPSTTPVPVAELSDATMIEAGGDTTCAVDGNGDVWCWGHNGSGQLGDGSHFDRSTPVKTHDIENVIDLSVGADFACAVQSNGMAKCWGNNSDYQLGVGTAYEHPSPVEVANLSNVIHIAAGNGSYAHSCAILQSGEVWCWGRNAFGQLGTGDTNVRAFPTRTLGIDRPATSLALGNQFSCALLETKVLKCWGQNSEGQLGQGHDSDLYSATPTVRRGQFIDWSTPMFLNTRPLQLDARSSSGTQPSYSTWTDTKCSLSLSTVTEISPESFGICALISATYSTEYGYAPAPLQRRLLLVGYGVFEDSFESP